MTFVDPKEILQKVRARNKAHKAAAKGDGHRGDAEPPPVQTFDEYSAPEDVESAPPNDAAFSNGSNGHAEVTGAYSESSGSLFDPWAQFVVPDFPLDVLPPAARHFVTSKSASLGVDQSAMAMAVLSTFSAALDHRHAIKMVRHDDWWAHPRLWILLVGDPSVKKTPAINAALKPLEALETHQWQEYEAKLKAHAEAAGKPEDAPPPPPPFVLWDATIEALGDMLARSDRGVLVKRDELAGWIGGMERYGSGSRGLSADRGFWLQAYNGGPYRFTRIKRGDVRIKNLSVSMIGGIQPERLREAHALTSDGLLQRFVPIMMTASRLAQDAPSDDYEPYAQLVRQLTFAKDARLILTDSALKAMEEIRERVHHLAQASAGLASGFQAWAGKLENVAGALTLILHMVAEPELGATLRVEQQTVEDAARIVFDFIVPHGFEFYRATDGNPGLERLRRLASYILTSGTTRIIASDLTTNVADMRGLALHEVNERVSPLISGGWLAPVSNVTFTNKAWQVLPAVTARFEERRRAEEDRKAALAKAMGSPRRANPSCLNLP
jgi:Protein of unknown function (DUF3987)